MNDERIKFHNNITQNNGIQVNKIELAFPNELIKLMFVEFPQYILRRLNNSILEICLPAFKTIVPRKKKLLNFICANAVEFSNLSSFFQCKNLFFRNYQ